MKNVMYLLMLSTFAVSCINLHGNLVVDQTMNVKKKGGFLNLKTKNVELKPGSYFSELKVNNDRSFTLKLRADKADDKDILIPIRSEKAFDLPANGTFVIGGSEISQPFDLNGSIATEITRSDITRTFEDCTWTRTERVCDKVCNTVPGGPNNRPVTTCDIVCHDLPITIHGERLVEFHYRYTHRDLNVQFNDLNSKAQLAHFNASGTDTDKVTDYYGECR